MCATAWMRSVHAGKLQKRITRGSECRANNASASCAASARRRTRSPASSGIGGRSSLMQASMCDQQGQVAVLEEMTGGTAEHEFGNARMTPCAHHDEVRVHCVRGIEQCGAVFRTRAECRVRRQDA